MLLQFHYGKIILATGNEKKFFVTYFAYLARNYYCNNLCCIGLYWILNSFAVLHTIGYGVLLTGMALAYASYQRTRFKRTETGTGIVEFIEGQISYFGPETGAIFSINDIKRLILDKSKYSSKWIIENTAGYQIEIPTNVEGHEVLFDVFNSLEGFPIHKMLETLSSKQSIRTVLWQK